MKIDVEMIVMKLIEEQRFDEISSAINKYEAKNPYDNEIYKMRALDRALKGDLPGAVRQMKLGLNKRRLNISNLLSLANMQFENEDYQEAADSLAKAYAYIQCFSRNEFLEEAEKLHTLLKSTMTDVNLEEKMRFYQDHEAFSNFLKLNEEGERLPYYMDVEAYTKTETHTDKEVQKDTVASLYKERQLHSCFLSEASLLLKEGLKQTLQDKPNCNILANDSIPCKYTRKYLLENGDFIIPISGKADQRVSVEDIEGIYRSVSQGRIENKNCESIQVRQGIFSFLRATGPSKIISDSEFIMGQPIEIQKYNEKSNEKRNDKPRLALLLQIDGYDPEELSLMPNLEGFFSDGIHFKNCFNTGTSTFQNTASLLTGQYPANHQIFGSLCKDGFTGDLPLLSELLHREYHCSCISNSSVLTPYRNAHRGFHRMINENADYTSCLTCVEDTILQLEQFSGCRQFIFLSYTKPKISTGPKEVDRHLGVLLDYIQKNYKPNERVVAFVATGNKPEAICRMNGALPTSALGTQEEYISIMDLYPSICKLVGAPHTVAGIDARLPKVFGGSGRPHVLVEDMQVGEAKLPLNRPYKAILCNNDYRYTFLSKNNIEYDATINLTDPQISDYNLEGYSETLEHDESKLQMNQSAKLEVLRKEIMDHIGCLIT